MTFWPALFSNTNKDTLFPVLTSLVSKEDRRAGGRVSKKREVTKERGVSKEDRAKFRGTIDRIIGNFGRILHQKVSILTIIITCFSNIGVSKVHTILSLFVFKKEQQSKHHEFQENEFLNLMIRFKNPFS